MPNPIRCFHGNAKPHEPFWAWRPQDAAQPESQPELELYGFISEYSWWGDEITPKQFKDDLYLHGKGGPVTVRINSGGGEMIAASMIRATLMDYPGIVTTRIDGLCASAAVGVALAGKKVQMQDSAFMMVHDPGYDLLMGWLDIQTLTGIVDDLKVFKGGLLDTYESRTGLSRDKLNKMLTDSTWMSATTAKELGFIDEVITGGKPITQNASVAHALQNALNVPAALLNQSRTQPTELDHAAQRLRDEIQLYL